MKLYRLYNLIYYFLTTRKLFVIPLILLFRLLLKYSNIETQNIKNLHGFHKVATDSSNSRYWYKYNKMNNIEDLGYLYCYKLSGFEKLIVFDGNGRLDIARKKNINLVNCKRFVSRFPFLTDILCYTIIRFRYSFNV